MKYGLRNLSLAAASGVALSVQGAMMTFDGVPSGTPANFIAPPGITFAPAAFLPDLDGFGDPIPGSDRWRPDSTAPDVTVENPDDYGRGAAPSPANALNALWQPVLVLFASTTDLLSFGTILDLDTFGLNGFEPAFSDVAVLFLDTAGNILASEPVNQTQPGFALARGPLNDLGGIVLPAGAFYDNLSLTAVPEVGAWPVVAGTGLAAFALWRRRAK